MSHVDTSRHPIAAVPEIVVILDSIACLSEAILEKTEPAELTRINQLMLDRETAIMALYQQSLATLPADVRAQLQPRMTHLSELDQAIQLRFSGMAKQLQSQLKGVYSTRQAVGRYKLPVAQEKSTRCNQA